ncbi:hypothetical protein [Staphylococcus pasteuri]|nr:hypothetical protein [Staphylococcus pasteuri]
MINDIVVMVLIVVTSWFVSDPTRQRRNAQETLINKMKSNHRNN